MNSLDPILSKSQELNFVTSISDEEFKKNYLRAKSPVVLKGYAKNWMATKKWNLSYLLDKAKNTEIGLLDGNFIQEDIKYKKSTLKDYLLQLKDVDDSSGFTSYLTTLDIFNYLPSLKEDTDFSIYETAKKHTDKAAWIGPKGTSTGLHKDTGDNFYAQIMGKKLFVIAPPKQSHCLYPSDKYIHGATASAVDIKNIDDKKFPKFKNDIFYHVILEPGDVLFLPKNWWHYVESLEKSISISNFSYSITEILKMKVLHSLHVRGYYKSKNCYCCK